MRSRRIAFILLVSSSMSWKSYLRCESIFYAPFSQIWHRLSIVARSVVALGSFSTLHHKCPLEQWTTAPLFYLWDWATLLIPEIWGTQQGAASLESPFRKRWLIPRSSLSSLHHFCSSAFKKINGQSLLGYLETNMVDLLCCCLRYLAFPMDFLRFLTIKDSVFVDPAFLPNTINSILILFCNIIRV